MAKQQAESAVRRAVRTTWKRREPVMWAAMFALVLTVQWPTLKGW